MPRLLANLTAGTKHAENRGWGLTQVLTRIASFSCQAFQSSTNDMSRFGKKHIRRLWNRLLGITT